MRPLIAALLLVAVASPVIAAASSFDTTVKTGKSWTQEFSSGAGDITASASFDAVNGLYYFEVREFIAGEWVNGHGVELDARWGRASGTQTLTVSLTGQDAGLYRLRFYAGRTTPLHVELAVP